MSYNNTQPPSTRPPSTTSSILAERKEKARIHQANYIPPDGGWGWLCVFSCSLTFALLVGMSRTFGAIYTDVQMAFPESKHTEIALIPSVVSALTVGCGVFAGSLSIAFSCRSVSFIGSFLGGLGICLCFFAKSILYMFFMFFIAGMGAGLACTPGLLIVSKYFKKRRVMAIGLALSGTSIGTFIHPPLMRALADKYGFRGALLIQGGILFHSCAAALLYREPEVPIMKRKMSRPQHEASAPSVIHWGSAMTHVPHDDVISARMTPTPTKRMDTLKSIQVRITHRRRAEWREGRYSLGDTDKANICCSWIEHYLFIDLSLFYNPVFVILLLATVFIGCTYPVSLFFIPPYAQEMNYSATDASSLLLVSAGGDLLGRLAFVLSMLTLTARGNYIWLCGTVFFHSAFSGACYMLIPVLLSEYHGTNKIASTFGIVRSCQGLFSMITPVVVGYIKDVTGSFQFGLLFLAACMSLSTVFLFLIIPVKARYRQKMGAQWPVPVPAPSRH